MRRDRVRALDGGTGRVEGMAVDPADGEMTHVLVVTGPWWRHRHVAVPAGMVVGMGPDGVRLLLTRDQVRSLGSYARKGGPGPGLPEGSVRGDVAYPSRGPSTTRP